MVQLSLFSHLRSLCHRFIGTDWEYVCSEASSAHLEYLPESGHLLQCKTNHGLKAPATIPPLEKSGAELPLQVNDSSSLFGLAAPL